MAGILTARPPRVPHKDVAATGNTLPRRRGSRGSQFIIVEPLRNGRYRITPIRVERGVAFGSDAWLVEPEDAAGGVVPRLPSGEVVLVLPRHEVVLKWLRLPVSDPAQVAKMAPYEAIALVPWPPEAIHTAFKIYSVTGQQSEVLLAVVRPEVLEDHLAALDRAGLAAGRVVVSTLCLAHLAGRSGVTRMAAYASGAAEYVRVMNGRPTFSRGEADPPSCVASWRASMALDQRRNGTDQDDGPIPFVVDAAYAGRIPLDERDGVVFEPLSVEPFLGGPVPQGGLSGTALGAALLSVDGSGDLDLLPERRAQRLARRRMWRGLRLAAVALAWLLIAAAGLCRHYFAVAETQAAAAAQSVAALQSEVGNLAAKHRDLTLLADERKAAGQPLRMVLALYEKTPLTIAISQMRFDSRGFLVLGGEAPSYADAFAYVDALR